MSAIDKYGAGWQFVADRADCHDDAMSFAGMFNQWQKQAILVMEITYAKDYRYIVPLGIFTDIGTLARALKNEFDKDWVVSGSLVGETLVLDVDKGSKGFRHAYECRYVELNQAYSGFHHEGWKFGTGETLRIPGHGVMPLIQALSSVSAIPKLDRSEVLGWRADADQPIFVVEDSGYLTIEKGEKQ